MELEDWEYDGEDAGDLGQVKSVSPGAISILFFS